MTSQVHSESPQVADLRAHSAAQAAPADDQAALPAATAGDWNAPEGHAPVEIDTVLPRQSHPSPKDSLTSVTGR